jgi:hypothetical protein
MKIVLIGLLSAMLVTGKTMTVSLAGFPEAYAMLKTKIAR